MKWKLRLLITFATSLLVLVNTSVFVATIESFLAQKYLLQTKVPLLYETKAHSLFALQSRIHFRWVATVRLSNKLTWGHTKSVYDDLVYMNETCCGLICAKTPCKKHWITKWFTILFFWKKNQTFHKGKQKRHAQKIARQHFYFLDKISFKEI